MSRVPFRMTPRRWQVLWNIAYSDRIGFKRTMVRHYGNRDVQHVCLKEIVGDIHKATDVQSIAIALKRAGLVRWHFGSPLITITPSGMQALLETVQ